MNPNRAFLQKESDIIVCLKCERRKLVPKGDTSWHSPKLVECKCGSTIAWVDEEYFLKYIGK